MKLITVLLVLNSALQVPDLSQAKGWRGIVPLHSTRTDVQRLLNATSNPECVPLFCTYYLADMNVQFDYSLGDCKLGGWDVPLDTVVGITVHLKSRPQLADLGI